MDRIVYFLIAAIGVLFVLSVLLMLFVINLWAVNRFTDERWERVKTKWQKKVFQIIMEEGRHETLSVPQGDALDFVDFLSELSRRLKGDAVGALSGIARPHLPKVAGSLKSSNPDRRAWAVRVLGTFGLPQYEKHLELALKDASPTVRMIAFHHLILKGRSGAVESLLESLPAFGKWNANILGTLIAQLGPSVIPVVRKKFSDPSVPAQSRTILAIALQRLNDPQAAASAADILKTPQSRNLHAACLRILSGVGIKDHLPLIRSICYSKDSTLRALAASALGRLGDTGDRNILQELLFDPSPWAALHAARGLKAMSALNILHGLANLDHPRKTLAKQILMEEGAR